jgi:hypothetical protein
MSTAFVDAMNAPATTKKGVKGSDVYTEEGVGDLRVSFYTVLVRGLGLREIQDTVKKILARPDFVRDLVVLCFQTRDIRGGKGERDLAIYMLTAILQERPSWARALVELVPEYGCWGDLWKLYAQCQQSRDAIDAVVAAQFALDQETQRPSLLAKWLPREGGKYTELARHFAQLLFPLTPVQGRSRVYRRTCATLNRYLNTTEVKMCARVWKTIEPGHVPGRLLKRCKLAFFNQKKTGRGRIEDRYPEDPDRVTCAQHFKTHLERVKSGEIVMKGGDTVMPHEIVREIEAYQRQHRYDSVRGIPEATPELSGTWQAQWDAIRAKAAEGGQLGKLVPMCDFSGSMDGVPKEVSLALGILISELATPAFKDHILTFDAKPTWHSFAGCATLEEKIWKIGGLGQGLNTNFQAAADLILARLVEHKVAPEDAPQDLLVLTDMGFDAACGGHGVTTRWETHFQRIRRQFEEAGYKAPRIICWNLRAEYKDFHARVHEQGVLQLSGWSPSALKALQTKGIEVQTPYQALRELLDAPRYEKVREVVNQLLNPTTSLTIDLTKTLETHIL